MSVPLRRELRALVRLAGPVVLVQVGLMLLGVVDTLLVGHLSGTALAAVAMGHLFTWVPQAFGVGTLFAIDPLVAQGFGAGDRAQIRRALQRGILLATWLTLPIALALWPAQTVLAWLQQPAEILPDAALYTRIQILGVWPFLLFGVLRQTLQSKNRLRETVIVILIGNALNAVADYALVFGALGLPALGVEGAAWATVGVRWAMALTLLGLAWPRLGGYLRVWTAESFALRAQWRLLRLGAPIGGQWVLEIGAFAVTALLMGTLGSNELAAHQVAINLASLSFMMPLGIGQAVSVRVGQAVGRGDAGAVRRSAQLGLLLGGGVMACCASLFLGLPGPIASLYTGDAAVAELAALLIPIAGVFQVFDGLQVVAIGILRGCGDTRAPLVVNVLGFWLLGVPAGLLLAFPLGMHAVGLWWGLVVGLFAVATFLLLRIRVRLRHEVRRLVFE